MLDGHSGSTAMPARAGRKEAYGSARGLLRVTSPSVRSQTRSARAPLTCRTSAAHADTVPLIRFFPARVAQSSKLLCTDRCLSIGKQTNSRALIPSFHTGERYVSPIRQRLCGRLNFGVCSRMCGSHA